MHKTFYNIFLPGLREPMGPGNITQMLTKGNWDRNGARGKLSLSHDRAADSSRLDSIGSKRGAWHSGSKTRLHGDMYLVGMKIHTTKYQEFFYGARAKVV